MDFRSPLNTVRKVIVTGGPGAGKTALLAELAARGYLCIPDNARAIIRERKQRGESPRPEPAEFAREILCRDIETYRATPDERVAFFDRGIPDALCMLDAVGLLSTVELDRYLSEYPYAHTVIVVPPWREIYRVDSERDQTFE